jgi:YegS/Rv2252/BmrU family lipid kinase
MYYFIVNTRSGSGKSANTWKKVKNKLKQVGAEYRAYRTNYEGHATELARNISRLNDDDIRIVIIGGDGTVNEVINGITDYDKVKVGLIPSGSGNDFARGLGIKGEVEDILQDVLIEENEDLTIDLGRVTWKDAEGNTTSRMYAISSGIGLDAIVCKKAMTSKLKKILNKLGLGKLIYLLLTVETLFSMTTFKTKMLIDDKEKSLDNVIFMANMNVNAEGGGVRMAPRAVANSGDMSMCTAWGIPKWKTFFLLPLLVIGKHEGIKGIDILKNVDCKIETDTPVVLHADGEYLADVCKIEYKCMESKLRMLNRTDRIR